MSRMYLKATFLFVGLIVVIISSSPVSEESYQHRQRKGSNNLRNKQHSLHNSDKYDVFPSTINPPVDDNQELEANVLINKKGSKNDDESSADKCIGCAAQLVERQGSPDDIKMLRIEDIKRQILQKLRLKNRPNVTISRDQLPEPLSDGKIHVQNYIAPDTLRDDDYYGRTEQVIVVAENMTSDCSNFSHHVSDASGCFFFSLAKGVADRDITSAHLWVRKLRDQQDSFNQTFVISELKRPNLNNVKRHQWVSIIQTSVKSGWIKFDVKHFVQRWLQKRHQDQAQDSHIVHGLEVSCKTCVRGIHDSPVSTAEFVYRPFLLLMLNQKGEKRREKRSIDCSEDTSHCCRESLLISFKDIGWDDWIIQPAAYTANFCRGSCLEDVAIPLGLSHHTTVLQRYAQRPNLTSSQKLILTPCCSPRRLSNISLLYIDDDGKLYQKNLPNMVVDSCGCS